ncbi:MAG TPA: MoaD/ThiS family protein [Methylomirabilota bacterium]
MPRVTIDLPSLLARVTGEQTLAVEADTLREALEQAFVQVPTLRGHLFDESGTFRRHVLCFLNDVNSRWLDTLDRPLKDGDCITILQAVSGG